tara:strand:- start:300 stop:503 length:204 start_codon:yes stop_codon:yes gene_type:complete
MVVSCALYNDQFCILIHHLHNSYVAYLYLINNICPFFFLFLDYYNLNYFSFCECGKPWFTFPRDKLS